MYVPERLLPAYVLLIGRRRCCGAPWVAPHLRGCTGRATGRPATAVTVPRVLLDRLP
jgi:hypothetical protein